MLCSVHVDDGPTVQTYAHWSALYVGTWVQIFLLLFVF